MKTVFLLLLIAATSTVQGQIESFNITKSDTIWMPAISFKKVAALHLEEATILVDYALFMKHLTAERKGLIKQIRARQRMIKRGKDSPGITLPQLKRYERIFLPVDSLYNIANQHKSDTFHVYYTKSPVEDFLPSAIENNQSIVLDINNHRQRVIIKKAGIMKNGQMRSVGSSFYFIPGATKYFLSKMDWIS